MRSRVNSPLVVGWLPVDGVAFVASVCLPAIYDQNNAILGFSKSITRFPAEVLSIVHQTQIIHRNASVQHGSCAESVIALAL